MPYTFKPEPFTGAAIREVTIGAGPKATTLGGENVFPLYSFDAPIKNPPKVGIEISDKWHLDMPDLPELKKFYEGCKTVPEFAKKAATAKGVSFISLFLESADPNGTNTSVDDCAKLVKDVVAAIGDMPLVIQGSKNVEKDTQLFTKLSEDLRGKNCLFISAKEDNAKQVAVAVVQAGEAKIGAESAVDLNLCKQLNTVISQAGIDLKNVVVNCGQCAAGYGFEYLITTMDRIKDAALGQKDAFVQTPIITPAGQEAWGVKEAVTAEAEAPANWGPMETRGIDMEITTATALIAAGSSAVILRHPKSIETVSGLVAALM
jgi:acetyl-CoA decarbonylase/synthase complex subunit delta